MGTEWLERVGSSIPRGFSRYFIINLLKEPHTGKEIIDAAAEQSDGIWKPSPGLIYPLLGRLHDEGLVEETDDGRYQITKKGAETAENIQKIREVVKKQLDVLFRVEAVGRFVASDLLERLSYIGTTLGANTENMTEAEISRYRQFLNDELERLDGRLEDTENAHRRGDIDTEIRVE